MKTNILSSLKLTVVLIIVCSVIYPLLIAGIGLLSQGNGEGVTISQHGIVVGYENIGQKFTEDRYFHGRPSAVDYNAAGSAGSNKGPSNRDYLAAVQERIDTFLTHNPGIKKEQIPSDLVTASGSGLDPDISVQAARIQVPRIAKLRKINEEELFILIDKIKEGPLFRLFGPEKINVLKLNIALNKN
jgi:K+-transporting ATPase ATPase C chain